VARSSPRLPVGLYFTPEWWDLHFHCSLPRPEAVSQQALEVMYLQRLRFLFEQFGACGLGQEHPVLGPGQIATVIRHGFDLVPVLLGTQLDLADTWGFYPRFRSLEVCGDLQPVDIARTAEGEWLLAEQARLTSLYGGCSHCLDLGSAINNAFRILGQDAYVELVAEPQAMAGLLDVILATMEHLYRFLVVHFGPMDPVPISNCNVSLAGPRTYERVLLSYDAWQNRFAERLNGAPPRAGMHHCDVPVDDFLSAYAHLPGLASLQASLHSDIAAAKERFPGAAFSALVSPASLNSDLAALEEALKRALASGVDDLAVWNVDAATSPDRLREIMARVSSLAGAHRREAQFSAQPLCWEEIEWAHGRYHSSDRA
jgi:hypothetical protein